MAAAPPTRPNVVLILADDMGFSDLGCYGSEIHTPNLDQLAAHGVRMSQFYNTARCSPSRASLLTGLHPHQTGIGVLTGDDGPGGYPGTINTRCVTIAEVLRQAGYTTAIRGKWHLTGRLEQPNDAWPTERGFDSFFGILAGAGSYYDPVTLTRDTSPVGTPPPDFYLTDALGRESASFIRNHHHTPTQQPFFLYLPFTAPHWPLHAPESAVDTYRDVYTAGWDELRRNRYDRLVASGVINGRWPLPPRDDDVLAWPEAAQHEWQARRMQVYAAQVELMDRAVGEVVSALRETDQLDHTLIMFLSDNGGCAEEMEPQWVDEMDIRPYNNPTRTRSGARVRRGNDQTVTPGGEDTFASYGKPWANLSNTPFREYKHWVHEGGIATPFIAHWPDGGLAATIDSTPHQLTDVMATVLEATHAEYPGSNSQPDVLPLEGQSMLASWRGSPSPQTRMLFFEHEGNCAIREGRWKLVRKYGQPWELYDLDADRTELTDLAASEPQRVTAMQTAWNEWSQRCGVLPYAQVLTAKGIDDWSTFGEQYRSSWRREER